MIEVKVVHSTDEWMFQQEINNYIGMGFRPVWETYRVTAGSQRTALSSRAWSENHILMVKDTELEARP